MDASCSGGGAGIANIARSRSRPASRPKIYEHVEGKYEFEVRADGATAVDPTPATTKISTIEC